MKIGISCNRFGKGGGFERYALDLARGLISAGERPAVFARRFDAEYPEYDAVERHTIPVRWLPGKLRDAAFSWGMRHAHRHCDVLIGCNRVAGADLAICGGTHRGYLQAAGKTPTSSDRRQIALETRHYQQARRVVAHSGLMVRELESLYELPADTIRLLYPPVDTDRFSPVDATARAALRRRYGFGDETVFLFPSSDHRRKGLDLLAEATLAAGSNAVLAVAGRTIGAQRPQVREMGYVTEMADLYRAADFTVLASNYEPFGLVGIESVLCGTPVVMADNIGCLEVMDDIVARRFSLADPASATRAFADAASRPGRLADPLAHLSYDPILARHLEGLRAMF